MAIHEYLGKTLKEVAEQTHISYNAIRVFILSGEHDDTGWPLGQAYSIQQILHQFPLSADGVIKFAEKYYGETILRISVA